MLIITGTGRCGTGTLAKIFGGHHEFRVGWLVEKYFLNADPFSDPFRDVDTRLAAVRELHREIDPASFVDSSNLYIHFIDAVHILEPSAKFVLLVRNGKDFVRSAFTRGWHERTILGEVPPRENRYYATWPTMTPVQKNAWIWTYRNEKALAGLRSIPPQNAMTVRIEDLTKEGVLNRIEAFSSHKVKEPAWAKQRYNANPSSRLPPREEWPEAMNVEFNTIAGNMMQFFGYE